MTTLFQRATYFIGFIFLTSCQDNTSIRLNSVPIEKIRQSNFYSPNSNEKTAEFNALYKTTYKSLKSFNRLTAFERNDILEQRIPDSLRYLFGPLTHRQIGGPQKNYTLTVNWSAAMLSDQGYINIPYSYKATWIIEKSMPDQFDLPLPFNEQSIFTTKWKKCTDSAADHQTSAFLWYFWDPERINCDHRLHFEYQMIQVKTFFTLEQQTNTYPEYKNLIRKSLHNNSMKMTFAFGYVDELENPYPDANPDPGMHEYRKFLELLRKYKFEESDILQTEYLGAVHKKKRIGSRFTFVKNGVNLIVNVVTSTEIDQMELFAKSFAHDNDGFFGWFGHSRIGSGFDAEKMNALLSTNSSFYKISTDYQLLYWGGCNSYSYYSIPFFKLKADLNQTNDTRGTKYLDIMSHGLPSFFSLNAINASTVFKALLDWENPTSFQNILQEIEYNANIYGIKALANVLGDEDNY